MPNPWNFNPRPPCGGRLLAVIEYPLRNNISIHALRVEGDAAMEDELEKTEISIHALRVEGDAMTAIILASMVYFNPRPPCGGRLQGSLRGRKS